MARSTTQNPTPKSSSTSRRKETNKPRNQSLTREEQESLIPDEKQVDAAVEFLKQKETDNLLQIRDVGKYLLDTFYQGDISLYRSKTRTQGSHAFNLICKRCNEINQIGWRERMLRNSIELYAEYMNDHRPWMDKISMSHQISLLPVKDQMKRDKLANKAADATPENPYSRNDLNHDIRVWRQEQKQQEAGTTDSTRHSVEDWKNRIKKRLEAQLNEAAEQLSPTEMDNLFNQVIEVVRAIQKTETLTNPQL